MFKEMSREEVIAIEGGAVCGAVIGFGLGLCKGALNDAFKQQNGEYNSKGAMKRIVVSGLKGGFAGALVPGF